MKVLLFVLLQLSVFAKTDYCKEHTENNKNEIKQQKIDYLINKAANNPLVAKKADAVLSKLITAKSPIINSWIKARNFSYERPAQIALAWRLYHYKNFLINNFKKQNSEVQSFINQMFLDADKIALSKADKKRLTKIFEQAKLNSVKYISSKKIDKKIKSKLLERIKSIKLYWFKELSGSKFENYPLEYIDWSIAYDPIPNEINIGVKALSYETDENLLAVFAHEIGHSIDPCRYQAFIAEAEVFNGVNQCLRSKLGVKKRDDAKMQAYIDKKLLSQEMAMALKANLYCNKKNYPPIGTQKDQLPETFADWFSAEVIATSGIKLKKIRNDLCAKKKLQIGSSYLSNQDRLEKIYLANPIIAKSLGLKNENYYCKFE